MKVYIVTNGYYSDREIVGVFSTTEAAKTYAGTFDDSEVIGYDVDQKQPNDRVQCWRVAIFLESGDESCAPCTYWIDRAKWRNDNESYYHCDTAVVRATSIRSLEHARKVAAEKRQHILRTTQC